MAHLRFQQWIARDDPNTYHVEIVVFLFQCRCTEAHAIAEAHVEMVNGRMTHTELRCDALDVMVREIVISQRTHKLPTSIKLPVELRKGVDALLTVCRIEFGIVEIVVEIVGSGREHIVAESMVIKQTHTVLHIGVAAHVKVLPAQPRRLVILVEAVRPFYHIIVRECPLSLSARVEVAIALW